MKISYTRFDNNSCTNGYSNRGFTVQVNKAEQKVLIDFDPAQIDKNVHPEWSKYVSKASLETQPYWGFDDLFYKVGTKLHNCFFVRAESKRINGELHFHYQDIFMLKALDKNKFIDAIENGNIYIDFDARTGHNHGTKFRLRNKVLVDLYSEAVPY
ncbi:MAG: MvaI/BcnI family restriction endonuclease [Verrucomicrobiales bacterium]